MSVRRKLSAARSFALVIERCYKNKHDDKEHEYFRYWSARFNGKKASERGISKLKENLCSPLA